MSDTLTDDDHRHGTVYAYSKLRCRCDRCRAAFSQYRRDRRIARSGDEKQVVAAQEPRPLMGGEDLATRLNISVHTLAKLRAKGVLPPAVKIGGSVRWVPEDVDAWIEAQRETEGRP